MTISRISTSDIITAAKYNEIQSTINTVLGSTDSGYGYPLSSLPVSANNIITAQTWDQLYDDISRCTVHITGSVDGIPNAASRPVPGMLVYATFVNGLAGAADYIYLNSTTAHPSQLAFDGSRGSSTRVSGWGSDSIVSDVMHIWNSETTARYFFNQGGNLRVALSASGDTVNADDIVWADLVASANIDISSKFYGLDAYLSNTTVSSTSVSGTNTLTATISRAAGNQIRTEVTFNTSGTNVNLNVTSSVGYYYSIENGNPDHPGVPALYRPQVVISRDLELNNVSVPVIYTKILSASPANPSFSGSQYVATSPQTITISNVGTTATTITSLSNSTNGVTANISYGWASLPTTLSSGGSTSISVSYSSNAQGNYNNSITINSDAAVLVIPTTQSFGPSQFDFSLSPTSWTPTTVTTDALSQKFTIASQFGTYDYYTIDLGGPINQAFEITAQPIDGPIFTFYPGRVPNGTYSLTFSISITDYYTGRSVTRSASITVTNAVVNISRNIGSWISARTGANAVIGISYDIINNKRFLTIGLGSGGDGSSNDLSTSPALTVADLNYAADPGYYTGSVMYRSLYGAGESALLNNFGMWIQYNTGDPQNVWIYRSFEFTVPVGGAGSHEWQFACDDLGYFTIDNVLVGDLRSGNNVQISYGGSVYLSEGVHTISCNVVGTGRGPTGIAVRLIFNGNDIWNTLVPVRPFTYRNWLEVYRIPIASGVPATYYSVNYCIKNPQVFTDGTMGSRFGSPGAANANSIFTVLNDGVDNVFIQVNSRTNPSPDSSLAEDITTFNFPYSFYYYADYVAPGIRYTQLETPLSGNQTHYFLGIDRNGTAITSILPIPDPIIDQPTPPIIDTAGGGG